MIGSRSRRQVLALDPHRFLALLADPLADVIGIGQGAQVLVLQLGDFLVLARNLLAQRGLFRGRCGNVAGVKLYRALCRIVGRGRRPMLVVAEAPFGPRLVMAMFFVFVFAHLA